MPTEQIPATSNTSAAKTTNFSRTDQGYSICCFKAIAQSDHLGLGIPVGSLRAFGTSVDSVNDLTAARYH